MKISIVIPTYNGARHLEEAILSVLTQSRPPDEFIVCDDGSTDDTLAICRRYAHRLTVYSNESGPSGFVNAWNKAVDRATGDYISILHQDDLLSPDFLRLGMAALEQEEDVRHLFVACRYIDSSGQELGVSYATGYGPAVVRYTGLEYVRAYQRYGNVHIHRCPGVITHRSIFQRMKYQPEAGHIADDDFFYRVGMLTDVIGLLRPLAAYRVHPESATGRVRDVRLAEQLMEDYLYQLRQWKDCAFLDADAYGYFVGQARRFARRCVGYGIRHGNLEMIIKAGRVLAPLAFRG